MYGESPASAGLFIFTLPRAVRACGVAERLAHKSAAANRSQARNLFTQVDVIAVDLSISVALFQIQLVLPRIERSELRTCLDQGAATMDRVPGLTTAR